MFPILRVHFDHWELPKKAKKKRVSRGLCTPNTPFYPITPVISKAPKHYHQRMSTRSNRRFFQTDVPVAVLINEWAATTIKSARLSG